MRRTRQDQGVLAGRILGALAHRGEKIGDLDPFIVAVANGLPLVTNDVRLDRRVVDLGFLLELANWRARVLTPPTEARSRLAPTPRKRKRL